MVQKRCAALGLDVFASVFASKDEDGDDAYEIRSGHHGSRKVMTLMDQEGPRSTKENRQDEREDDLRRVFDDLGARLA